MKLEVLFFEGCPNIERAIEHARAAAAIAGITDIRLVRVENAEEARRMRFLGSPTVRVDDLDVDVSSAQRSDFGLQCRVYDVEGRLEGAPPVDWISAALRPR